MKNITKMLPNMKIIGIIEIDCFGDGLTSFYQLILVSDQRIYRIQSWKRVI